MTETEVVVAVAATVAEAVLVVAKDVMHLQSAHKYCNETFQMMCDSETRWIVKETSVLKLTEVYVYQKDIEEVKSISAKITDLEKKVRKYLDHAATKPGCDILPLDRMLGLSKICGECIRRKRQDCTYSLSYSMSKYGLKSVKGKLQLMESIPLYVSGMCEDDYSSVNWCVMVRVRLLVFAWVGMGWGMRIMREFFRKGGGS